MVNLNDFVQIDIEKNKPVEKIDSKSRKVDKTKANKEQTTETFKEEPDELSRNLYSSEQMSVDEKKQDSSGRLNMAQQTFRSEMESDDVVQMRTNALKEVVESQTEEQLRQMLANISDEIQDLKHTNLNDAIMDETKIREMVN